MPASSQLLSRLRSNASSQGMVFAAGAPTTPPTVTAPALAVPTSPPVAPPLATSLDLLEQAITAAEAQAAAVVPAPAEPSPPVPVMTGVPTVAASSVPLAVDQATNTLNPTTPTTTYKETAQVAAPEQAAASPVDLGGGYQLVEVEKAAEIPVEVEGYLQEVQDHAEQQPQEIVIADGSIQMQPTALPVTKVVILPITPEVEKVGKHKSTSFSLRWLVEWSQRLMKIFSGKIIYKPAA